MKRFLLTATIAISLALPASAQTQIPAPSGWTTQVKAGGARTFSPPDSRAGEKYSVTVYDSAPLNGQALGEYVRKFAGPVGKTAGKLGAPLQITTDKGRIVRGVGIYVGPNNSRLFALFDGISLDGGINIHMMRTLMSQTELAGRYKAQIGAITAQFIERAKAEAGDNIFVVPRVVSQKLKVVGGPLKAGVYAGNSYHDQELRQRLRVYLYPTGEYRICDDKDEDLGSYGKTGNIDYNRNSGKLDLDWTMDLGFHSDDQFCYFGRDASGQPVIYAQDRGGYETHTLLTWVEPPLKRLSKTQEDEQKAEIEAIKNRFKWTVAPGKGVPNAKIAAILLDSKYDGQSVDETTYLLLKDGSVYADLPVAPDELDVIRSRQKEPDKWGKWRKTAGGYKVSWANSPFQDLPGSPVVPSPAQQKLNGRWGTARFSGMVATTATSSQWGVTFGKNGRFKKDSHSLTTSNFGFGDDATHIASGHDDDESFAGGSGPGFAFSSEQKKKNPNGNREGDYSINGYVLTLRFDNGKTKRLPFFFGDNSHKTLWFEGSSLSLDDDKK